MTTATDLVAVSAADLTTVLDQRNLHCHRRPGIWDDDNPPDRAGTRCVECAARERLLAAMRATEPDDLVHTAAFKAGHFQGYIAGYRQGHHDTETGTVTPPGPPPWAADTEQEPR
jgi:hypothetical protein